MFDFDLENLATLEPRIAETRKTESIYNTAVVDIYLEIKESLVRPDLEAIWDTKVESLLNHAKAIELYRRDGIPELDHVSRHLAYQKFVETFVFLRTTYRQGVLGPREVGTDPFAKAPAEKPEEVVAAKVAPKEAQFFDVMRQFFALSAKPTDEVRQFLAKDFLKVDNVDEEIQRTLGLKLGEDRETAWSEEVAAEVAAKKELRDLVVAKLLPEKENQ